MKAILYLLVTTLLLSFMPRMTEAQIIINHIEPFPDLTCRIRFYCDGSVSNYTVQFCPNLTSNNWQNVIKAPITGLGGGQYEAGELPTANQSGFFRILSAEELRAWFDEAAINVNEGNSTIELTIIFSGYFQGTLTYTIEGTGLDSIDGLSGEVEVNGTSVTLPITLRDNSDIDSLRYISISIQGTSGVMPGSPGSATVNILENDAVWHGLLQTESGSLGFRLRIEEENQSITARFTNSDFGFFPSTPVSAQVTRSESFFEAVITDISVAPESTPMNIPISMDISLSANNALENESVESDHITGSGLLMIRPPFHSYLNATQECSFILQQEPVSPSTNEIELVEIP